MTTELTQLPAADSVRRLKMAKAIIPTIKPDLLNMGNWFEVRDPDEVEGLEDILRYDKGDVHLCGTAACFAGQMALRKEFQALGLGFTECGSVSVSAKTTLPDGSVVVRRDTDRSLTFIFMTMSVPSLLELAWFLGIELDEAVSLFMPSSWLHTDDEGNRCDPKESLKAIDGYLDELITRKETA